MKKNAGSQAAYKDIYVQRTRAPALPTANVSPVSFLMDAAYLLILQTPITINIFICFCGFRTKICLRLSSAGQYACNISSSDRKSLQRQSFLLILCICRTLRLKFSPIKRLQNLSPIMLFNWPLIYCLQHNPFIASQSSEFNKAKSNVQRTVTPKMYHSFKTWPMDTVESTLLMLFSGTFRVYTHRH